MRYTLFIPVIVAFGVIATEVQAADVIVRNVNLGACTTYSDGCNTHVIKDGVTSQTTHNTCIWEGIPQCLDSTDPTARTLATDFRLKKFSSCDNMESVMKGFIKDYYNAHPYSRGYFGGGPIMMEDNLGGVSTPTATSSDAVKESTSATDVSNTNLQVAGVDESELIKTDGTYIYYYNTKDHTVYIARAFPATDLSIVKKIKIPESFIEPKLFLQGKKLIILGTKYNNIAYGYRYWFNRQVKTVVVVYDISDVNNLRINKYYETDGNVSESRMIGKYLYVLSSSNLSFPYDLYYGATPL